MPGSPPRLPFVQAAGLATTVRQINVLLREIHGVPLPEIGHNIANVSASSRGLAVHARRGRHWRILIRAWPT